MSQVIQDFASQHAQTAIKVYKVVILGAMVIGAVKGLGKWMTWRNKRNYRKINYPTIEPVVNIAVDVGNLAYHVVVAGVASGAVAATCPISVPILLSTCEERPVEKDIKDTGVVRN